MTSPKSGKLQVFDKPSLPCYTTVLKTDEEITSPSPKLVIFVFFGGAWSELPIEAHAEGIFTNAATEL